MCLFLQSHQPRTVNLVCEAAIVGWFSQLTTYAYEYSQWHQPLSLETSLDIWNKPKYVEPSLLIKVSNQA